MQSIPFWPGEGVIIKKRSIPFCAGPGSGWTPSLQSWWGWRYSPGRLYNPSERGRALTTRPHFLSLPPQAPVASQSEVYKGGWPGRTMLEPKYKVYMSGWPGRAMLEPKSKVYESECPGRTMLETKSKVYKSGCPGRTKIHLSHVMYVYHVRSVISWGVFETLLQPLCSVVNAFIVCCCTMH